MVPLTPGLNVVLFVNDSKKEKIMKKVLYSVLALAGLFAVSCAKEMNSPEDANIPTHEVTIVATGSLDTKTSYADGKTFSWVVRDSVYVYTTDGSAGEFVKFYAKSTAATSEFTGEVKDGYRPNSIAFYPAESAPLTLSGKTYTFLPTIYNEEGRDPYSYTPMVGIAQKDGSFNFSTATGLIKFSFTDLDEKASFVHLKTTGEKISGYFFLNENPYYEMTNAIPAPYASYGRDYMWHEFVRKSDGTAEVVIPIPVGTIKAGCNVMIEDENDNVLFQTTTTKDIVVERNKVVEIAPLKAKYDWQNVGTGKYIDTRVWADAGWDIATPVDVTIETTGDGVYRVANPYGAAATAFGYKIPSEATGPGEYLMFSVLPVGSTLGKIKTTIPDLVNFEQHYTGIVNTTYKVDPFIAHPTRWSTSFSTEDYYASSIVTKYASDGTTPAALQLAPVYFWMTDPEQGSGSYTGSTYLKKNGVIQLLFPGETSLLDLTTEVAFDSMVDDTPAQPIAKANVKLGSDVESIDVVVAANATDAAAAFSSGTNVVKVTSTSSVNVNFPAEAESGTYYVFGKVSLASSFNQALAQTLTSEAIKYVRKDAWNSLGTGKFVDNYVWATMGGTEDTPVDVEILADKAVAGHYRVVDPYRAAATAFGYTMRTDITPASDYVDVYVQADGTVKYDMFCTGVYNSTYQESTVYQFPTEAKSTFPTGRNYVMKYLSDGTTPANIAIAPVVRWPVSGYWTSTNLINNDGLLQIIFPGAALVDISANVRYVEVVDDTPATAKIKVSVLMGDDLTAVKMVVAANAKDAAAAFAAGTKVTTVTASGEAEIALPDDPKTGDYLIYFTTVLSDGINAIAAHTEEEAGSFKYVNPNDDAGWTLADLVGTYKSNNMYIAYYSGGWQWGSSDNFYTFVVEESDDPAMGDVKITSVVCTTAQSGFELTTTSDYGPIYGYFNTATGAFTVPGGQPLFWSTASVPVLWTGGREDHGIDFYLDKAGHLVSSGRQYISVYPYSGSSYRILGGSNVDQQFTRQDASSSAPAAAPRANVPQATGTYHIMADYQPNSSSTVFQMK